MTFVELLHKALNDHKFGYLLVSDPKAALEQVGVEPTPARLEALRTSVHALKASSVAFEAKTVDNI
jgi:hypothetical protein